MSYSEEYESLFYQIEITLRKVRRHLYPSFDPTLSMI